MRHQDPGTLPCEDDPFRHIRQECAELEVPFGVPIASIVNDYFAAAGVVSVVVAVTAAWLMERRRRSQSDGGGASFRWGYFQGSLSVMLGIALLALLSLFVSAFGITGLTLVAIIAAIALYIVPGIYVLKRRRWAWIVTTIVLANPLVWVISAVYGARRWNDPHIWPGASNRRGDGKVRLAIQRWHSGKVAMLWGIAAVLLIVARASVYPHNRSVVTLLWLLFVSPLAVITWIWLSGREGV